MPYGDGIPKKEGQWDWLGNNDPAWNTPKEGVTEFKIGVFKWKRKKTGGGTKRGRAVKHFKALIDQPQEAYAQALAFIKEQKR